MYLNISSDKMEAKLSKTPNSGGEAIFIHKHEDLSGWKKIIREAGVVFGVQQEVLKDLYSRVEELSEDASYKVASGVFPIDDGVQIDFKFKHIQIPEVDSKLPADFYSLGYGVDVYQGQLLAEQVILGPGKVGTNIYAEKLPYKKKFSNSPLTHNNNVTIEKTGSRTKFFSKIDGVLLNHFKDSLEVQPVLMIRNSVDFKVGNLSTQFPIEIDGDVVSGFSVRSGNTIKVRGVVEKGAIIEARGDISLEKGASQESFLISESSIYLKYAQGATIKAKRDVVVSGYLYDCKVKAGQKVVSSNNQIKGEKGSIIGGYLNAYVGMELQSVGSANALTTLSAGFDADINSEIESTKENVKKLQEEMLRLIRALRINIFDKDFSKKLKLLSDLDKKRHTKIIHRLQALKNKKSELGSQLDGLKSRQKEKNIDTYIKIFGVCYPDVRVVLNNYNSMICDKIQHVIFAINEDSISKNQLE